MKSGKNTKQTILNAIMRAKPPHVTIQDIADKTGFSRETVSKYMAVLKAEGKIRITKTIGKANLFEAEK